MSKSFTLRLLEEAREYFIEGDYKAAEPVLNQPSLVNSNNPEVFQMLATIYYNRGQFNKAVKTFRKALEVDPEYCDAAVGLSIILNDLGKYEEAKKIFDKAQNIINQRKQARQSDNMDEKFAQKHIELGDLYLQHNRFESALMQYQTAQKLTTSKVEISMTIAECYSQFGQTQSAIQELRALLQSQPQAHKARLKLGMVLYNNQKIAEAVDQWEHVIRFEPKNEDALRYLKMAQATGITDIQL